MSNVIVTVELAGIAREDVKVEVVEEALVIEGERKLKKEEKEEGFFRSERSYGQAELANGILGSCHSGA